MSEYKYKALRLLEQHFSVGSVSEELIDIVADALSTEYKRGARKAHQCCEQQAEARGRRKMKKQCEYLLSELGYPQSDSQPAPKYTVEQATAYANDLVNTALSVANHNSVENNEDLAEMRQAVIGAIAGSAKPAPQFDAEKVRELIVQYGKLHTACVNTKSFLVDDCAEMQATYYKLLAALGIDY